MTNDQVERFWSLVRRDDSGCWEWGGSRTADGYGRIGIGGRTHRAHRVSWELAHGPVPSQMCVCHHCDNPPCVNPAHLFLGTQQDDVADRHAKHRDAHGDKHGSVLHPDAVSRGEANGQSVLTAAGVATIRRLGREGMAANELARRFGVSGTVIRDVLRGRSWRHVGEGEASAPIPPPSGVEPRARGERNGASKLVEADVRSIRALHSQGVSIRELSRRFGVARFAIFRIVRGEAWQHVA